MTYKFLPVLLIVASGATYHACQKLVSRHQDPWAVLSVVYFIAFATTLVLSMPWRQPAQWMESVRASLGPAGVGLALACIGIEVGVLVAYRIGWKVSLLTSYTAVSSCVAVMLVGVLVFRETVSPTAAFGASLAAVGVGLMHLK
jgi:drug/metabolite transporter (DMT)-like permease